MNAKVTHKFIDGARHDLKNKDDAVAELVTRWISVL